MKILLDDDIINLSYVYDKLNVNKRKEYLNKHPYKIWEGTDGLWHTYLPDIGGKGRVSRKRRTQKEIEDIVIQFWKNEELNPLIDDVFNEWNDRRFDMGDISSASHLRYRQTYNRHYQKMGKRRIKSVTPEEFSEFLENQISECNLTHKGFSDLKCITRGFLKRAKKLKYITWNIEEMLDDMDYSEVRFKRNIKEDYEEVFDESETDILLSYIKEHPDIWNLGIALMFVTGMRIGEAVTLKWQDVESNCIRIRRTETRINQNGETVYAVKDFPKSAAGVRVCIVPDSYMWILDELRDISGGYEFIFYKDGRRMTTNCLRTRLSILCKNLNIYHKSPHKIRKTYGTILLDNNVDKNMVIQLMGHSDILCTENYYHRNRKTTDKEREILDGIPDFKGI